MSERFEIGEVAVIASCEHTDWLIGKEVTITGPLQKIYLGDRVEDAHAIEPIQSNIGLIKFAERRCLRKKKPPRVERECDRIVSWDQCDWRPIETAVLA